MSKLPFYLNILVLLVAVVVIVTAFVLRATQSLPWDQVVGMALSGSLLAAIAGIILRFDLKKS